MFSEICQIFSVVENLRIESDLMEYKDAVRAEGSNDCKFERSFTIFSTFFAHIAQCTRTGRNGASDRPGGVVGMFGESKKLKIFDIFLVLLFPLTLCPIEKTQPTGDADKKHPKPEENQQFLVVNVQCQNTHHRFHMEAKKNCNCVKFRSEFLKILKKLDITETICDAKIQNILWEIKPGRRQAFAS